jgi:nicotinate-nucleotide pyrophosphorylase (carboxylating)
MAKEFQQIEWDALVEDECRRVVRAAVLEDLDRGQDWTTLCLTRMDAVGKAAIVARQVGVIAGLPAVKVVIDEMDRRLGFSVSSADGATVQTGTRLGTLEGPARSLLTAERLILNLLGRLSGIATQTRRFVDAVAGTSSASESRLGEGDSPILLPGHRKIGTVPDGFRIGSKARIYDTRKTTPGWRRMEKYAVRQGGGCNHRTGLFDAILIKDNHLALGARSESPPEHWQSQWHPRFTPAQAVRLARHFIDERI